MTRRRCRTTWKTDMVAYAMTHSTAGTAGYQMLRACMRSLSSGGRPRVFAMFASAGKLQSGVRTLIYHFTEQVMWFLRYILYTIVQVNNLLLLLLFKAVKWYCTHTHKTYIHTHNTHTTHTHTNTHTHTHTHTTHTHTHTHTQHTHTTHTQHTPTQHTTHTHTHTHTNMHKHKSAAHIIYTCCMCMHMYVHTHACMHIHTLTTDIYKDIHVLYELISLTKYILLQTNCSRSLVTAHLNVSLMRKAAPVILQGWAHLLWDSMKLGAVPVTLVVSLSQTSLVQYIVNISGIVYFDLPQNKFLEWTSWPSHNFTIKLY